MYAFPQLGRMQVTRIFDRVNVASINAPSSQFAREGVDVYGGEFLGPPPRTR